MKRSVAAFFAGLVGWILIASVIDRGLRWGLAGYAEAEPTMQFSLPMLLSRLAMAVVAGILAGVLVKIIAPASRITAWLVGGVWLVLFIPQHIHLWHVFPIWYHLFFLLTLAPLVALGAYLAGLAGSRESAGAATAQPQ
jgi:hypothetical protein